MSRPAPTLTYTDRRAIALASASGGARSLSGKFRWTSRGQTVAHTTIRRLLDRGLMARVDESTVELTGAGHELAETLNVDQYVDDRRVVASEGPTFQARSPEDDHVDAPSALGTDGLPMPVDVYFRRFE